MERELQFWAPHSPIPPKYVFKDIVYGYRYSGSYPDGVPGSQSYSINPRIAIFTSDSTIAGQGFEIRLRSELGSETTETPTTTSEPLPPVEQLGKHLWQKYRLINVVSRWFFKAYAV